MMNQEIQIRGPFDTKGLRELARAVNALRKMRVIGGQFFLSDQSCLLNVGGVSGSAVTVFKISTIPSGKKDYFLAKTWDGTTLGSEEIAIAKRYHQRPSVTAVTILGTSITYSYSDDNHRTASDGANPTQNEELYEPFEVDSGSTSGWVIAAQVANATGVVDGDGAAVEWIDLTPRVWAKY